MRRLWLWTLLVLLLTATPVAAADVAMTVEPAFNGWVKEGEWVTLWIDLQSEGEAVSGEVVVRLDPPSGLTLLPDARYAVPFDLPAGGRQRLVVSLPDQQSWPVLVELHAGGEVVQRRIVDLSWQQTGQLLVGVLSDDDGLAATLGQLRSGDGAAQVVRLTAEDMPDSATLLSSLDLIAISRFDSGALTDAQRTALEVWMARGGTLLLFGGPEWERTLGALLRHLLPVEPAGTVEVSLASLGEVAGVPLAGSGVVSAGPLARGEAVLWAGGPPAEGTQVPAGNPVLAAVARVGSGRVIYLAFDPAEAPLAGWAGQAALLDRLVGALAGPSPLVRSDWRLQNAVKQLPDWGLPSVWLVGLVLGSYLVVVGPVNYLVLRRMDRREWAWFTVPVLSLVFLGVVYGLGAGRFQKGITHLMTATELVPGSETGVMTTHAGVYAPGRTRLSLPLPDARLVRALIMANLSGEAPARIVAGDPVAIELSGLNNYNMAGFSLEQPVTLAGGLELVDLAISEAELTGRVRNGLPVPVAGVEVLTDRSAASMGTLDPGETSAPFRIRLSGDPDPGPKGVLYPLEVPAELGADPRREELRAYVWEAGQGRLGSSLLVLGWTDEPLAEPSVAPVGRLATGVHLVCAFHPLPSPESGDLPAGVVLGRPVDPAALEPMGNGSYYAPPGSHGFVITLPPLQADRVAELALDLRGPVREAVMSVYVRNQRAGEWLHLTEQRTALPNWQDFVLPGGIIELRYDLSTDAQFLAPTVAVKGVRG